MGNLKVSVMQEGSSSPFAGEEEDLLSSPDRLSLCPIEQKDIRDRLLKIEGHLGGIRRMLEEQKSCTDILIQLSAVKAALVQVTIKLTEGHMDSSIQKCLNGRDKETAVAELKGIVSKALKQI